ncbi:MAG: hypothetical protein QG652_167 [Pseudomonadota bacterium]|nr:hypothetical protein [Pseudomonadota bacterium]
MGDTTISIDSATITFSETEWKSLLNSPFIIFLAVAVADGKLDKKEAERFAKILAEAGKYRCPILSRILAEALPHFMEFINGLLSGKINPLKELMTVTDLADARLSANDAKIFKLSLMSIAKEIAESSGGFLGFGSKISKDEMKVINSIAATLKLAA